MKMQSAETTNHGGGGMLQKLAYFFLIIFFIMGAIAAFIVISTARTTQQAVAPVTDLFNSLFVEATPIILPSSTTIVHEINDLARLETASVEMEKVVTAERNSETLWGVLGESMIFVANGKIVAGIDFAEMEEEDLQVVDPDTVMVHLPEAKIFDDLPALDNEKSYVADRDTGLLTRADPELESEVRRIAEARLREEALASGVVEQAEFNAEEYMLGFLNSLGFENVIFMDETPPVPQPFEQEIPKGYILSTPAPTAP